MLWLCTLVLCSAVNLDWARYIVALGALMGIVTTTLVSKPTLCRLQQTWGPASGKVL